jgi:hypothetical protein
MSAQGLLTAENVWAEVSSVGQLDGLLDRLELSARDEPFVVELSRAGRGSLGLGLGAAEAVLTFQPEEPGAPLLVARRRRFRRAAPHEPFRFRFRGDADDFPPEAAVEGDEAREAMRAFLRTGETPAGLDWIEIAG